MRMLVLTPRWLLQDCLDTLRCHQFLLSHTVKSWLTRISGQTLTPGDDNCKWDTDHGGLVRLFERHLVRL